MPFILGLDPSIKKTGYCILDTDAPYDQIVESGRLKTSALDGILVQKLILQAERIKELIIKYKVAMVSMEAPYFGGNEAERLFALNQFLHRVFLEAQSYVITFPPQQMKILSVPGRKAQDIGKPHMVAEVKKRYHLRGRVVPDDEADALNAGHLGKLFYNWHFAKKLGGKDLPPGVYDAFAGKHEFVKGLRKGTFDYYGLVYRENELFFDFKAIAERKELYGTKEDARLGTEPTSNED